MDHIPTTAFYLCNLLNVALAFLVLWQLSTISKLRKKVRIWDVAREGYMCAVDYQYELGDVNCQVYPSLEQLAEQRNCIAGCGAVKVKVISVVDFSPRVFRGEHIWDESNPTDVAILDLLDEIESEKVAASAAKPALTDETLDPLDIVVKQPSAHLGPSMREQYNLKLWGISIK